MGHLNKLEPKKRQLSSASLLKEEIVQLQTELEGQTVVRYALEKVLIHRPLLDDSTYKSLSQPAENLIKEISLLELEVVYLEKYLLSMYRTSFAKRLSPLPKTDTKAPCLESVSEESVIRVGGDDPNKALPLRYKKGELLGDENIDRAIMWKKARLETDESIENENLKKAIYGSVENEDL